MKNIILLLCAILMSTSISAQVLQDGVPVILNEGGISGEQIFSTSSDGTNFTIISQSDSQLYSNEVTSTGTNSQLNSTSTLPASGDFSVRYLDNGATYLPTFHKTDFAGTAPNRNVTLEGLSSNGSTEYLQTYSTPEDDFGLKAIAARSPIGGVLTDGAFTVAARASADGLYQLVAIRTANNGSILWETVIPMDQTGYDIIFQGFIDDNGEFAYETSPVPPVSIVEEVADGYLIVNQNKFYSPPTTTQQFANIIKLDFAGNVLWNTNIQIPWRELEIGSNSSLNLGQRGRVTSVEGTADGSTYFTFSSSNDINPNAQFRKLDNTGAVIENFSTSWIFNDNFSWFIKEIDGEVFWVKLSEIFTDNGIPANDFDFAIFNITNGITNVEAANNPTAFLPDTPDETFIPKDLERLANGDFLVTGNYYANTSFAESVFSNTSSQPFVLRLENLDLINNLSDVNLSVSANDVNVGIYDEVELTYTVTNEGSTTATGLISKISRTSTSVLASSTPPVASQGILSLGYAENALWEIGDLAPGQTETLSLTYFTLAVNTSFFGEISAMNEADSDSTPDNGTFGNAQEDDEAGIEIGNQPGTISGTVFLDENRDGGENCTADGCTFIPGIEIKLYILNTDILVGTAVSQSDGSYIFPNVTSGFYLLEYESQNNYVPTPFFNEPLSFEFKNDFFEVDGVNPYAGVTVNGSNENVFNLGLVDGTECTLEELFVETTCNDNGTPNNPNDDTFNVNFRADGNGRASFTLNGNGGQLWNNSIIYSEGFKNIGPFDMSELPVTLTVNNLGNLPNVSCALSETVNSVDCGDTGNGDLPDLAIATTGNIPASIQPGEIYPSAVDITNLGASFTSAPINFFNGIFLSNDAIFDDADILISNVGLNNLAAGASNPFLSIFVPENTELGDYFILAVVDNTGVIEESNENNNVLARPVTVGPIGTGDVDLELTASADVPAIYQNGQAVFTITNTGSQTATNVEVLFAKNTSLNIIGNPITSQGSTDQHWTNAPEWSVGSLAAGQSETITFNVFSLSNEPTLYGQVAFQSETDVDSTPNNGNGTSANEDDEASYPDDGTIITPTPCEILNSLASNRVCSDNGTPDNPSDDTFTFNFIVSTIGSECEGASFVASNGSFTITGNLNETVVSPPALISDGSFDLTITLQNTESSYNETIEIIAPEEPCSIPNTGGNGVDLQLTASSEAPTIYQNGTAIFTITNNGDETATGVKLEFHKNNTVNITGAPVTTQGTSQLHWTEVPRWNVGSLTPGQSATITYVIFSLSDDINFYGQVAAQNETDADSAPNNGNGTTPAEDDEVSYPGATPSLCSINVAFDIVDCDNQGTSDPSDDTFSYSFLVTNSNPNAVSYDLFIDDIYGGTALYNQPFTSPFFLPFATGTATYIDSDDSSCRTDFTRVFPEMCGVEIVDKPDLTLTNLTPFAGTVGEISEYTVSINNIGSADVNGNYTILAYLSNDNLLGSDDMQVGEIYTGFTPIGSEPLTTGSITIPANQSSGSYFLILEIDTNGDITESNENNNLTSTPLNVSNPNTNGGVDLELTASSDVPTIYQSGTATFTITNNGDEVATGIELEFQKNDNLNITGTPTTTQGTSQLHWTNTPRWNVGTLAAGQSEAITFSIFTLSANVNLYGQVSAQNEADADSTPNNGNGTTAVEDDEANYPEGGSGANPTSCSLEIEIGTVSCSTAGTPNDNSDDYYNFTFTVEGQNASNTALINANANVPALVNIGQAYTVTNIPASEAHVVLTAIDPDNSTCQGTATVNPPGTCGQGLNPDGVVENITLETNELSAQLYPVPTRENLTIDVYTQNESETQLFVRDTHGKILTTRNLAAQHGMQTVQIATGNWAKGVYFLQLFNGEEMQTYRFVKQ